MTGFEFKPDDPISEKKEDAFQRFDFSKRIATIINERRSNQSLVIGIYGKWGEGKSSVLNFIKSNLSEGTQVININPWYFPDDQQLIKSFLENIANALGDQLPTRKEAIVEAFRNYGESTGSFFAILFPKWEKAAKLVGKILPKVAESFKPQSLENNKDKVKKLITDASVNFVVFMDDIDRLSVSEIQAVFKLVKLVGEFPRLTYVLAFDDELVAASLAPKYGDGSKISGYKFLEKIVQLPLNLPKANMVDLRSYTLKLLQSVLKSLDIHDNEIDFQDFLIKFDLAFVPAMTNPRFGVRFANAVALSIPLVRGEVNLSDFLIVEAIKVFFPELYEFIKLNPQLFVKNYNSSALGLMDEYYNNKDTAVKDLNEKLEAVHKTVRKKLLDMLKDLFPLLNGLFGNTSYNQDVQDQWYIQKRISSAQYFERFFSYVVTKGDISDVSFQNLFSGMLSSSSSEMLLSITKEISKVGVGSFLFKLSYFIESMPQPELEALAAVLPKLGQQTEKSVVFDILSQKSELSRLILKVIKKTDEHKWEDLAKETIQAADPFELSMNLYINFNADISPTNSSYFLDDHQRLNLTNCLVNRFLGELTNKQIFDFPSEEVTIMLRAFDDAGRVDEIKKILIEALNLNHDQSIFLLNVLARSIISYGPYDVYKVRFTYEQFLYFKKFVDLKLMYELLTEQFGFKDLVEIYDSHPNEGVSEAELIALFQTFYNLDVKNSPLELQ